MQDGWTPAHVAASFGRPAVMKQLLALGADVDVADVDGFTPLILASANGHLEVVVQLLGANASALTLSRKNNWSSLEWAVIKNHPTVVLTLLQRLDATSQAPCLARCVHVAARHDKLDMLLLLIAAGAVPDAKTSSGCTPLHRAAGKNAVRTVCALLDSGANANPQDNAGNTPLHVAAQAGAVDVVEVLVDAGVDVAVENLDGDRAIDVALVNGHADTLRVLQTAMRAAAARRAQPTDMGEWEQQLEGDLVALGAATGDDGSAPWFTQPRATLRHDDSVSSSSSGRDDVDSNPTARSAAAAAAMGALPPLPPSPPVFESPAAVEPTVQAPAKPLQQLRPLRAVHAAAPVEPDSPAYVCRPESGSEAPPRESVPPRRRPSVVEAPAAKGHSRACSDIELMRVDAVE